MKKRVFFGIIGFLISFFSLFFYIGPVTSSKDAKEITYEDAINGWLSFGDILSLKLSEPVSLNDEIFVSILMEEFITNISEEPRITITRNNHIILWDTVPGNIRKKYTGWKISSNEQEYEVTDSISLVGTPIKVEGVKVGYVYIRFGNISAPQDILHAGWKNYASILSYSIREEISSKNISKISKTIKKTSERDYLKELTVLALDKTILFDMDKTQIGKDFIKGWIDKSKTDKESLGNSYIYIPVDFQGKKTGEIHFLIASPTISTTAKEKAIFGIFPLSLFKINNIIYPIIFFILLFIIGGFLGGAGIAAPSQRVVSKASLRKFEAELDELKKGMEKLRIDREKLVSEIAEKQKEKKDLESEVGTLLEAKEEKEYLPEEMAEGTTVTKVEEEKLLFEKLFEDEDTRPEKGKEELELTQRIVSKRREEISISARVEAKRKELIELQRNIDESRHKLEKYE